MEEGMKTVLDFLQEFQEYKNVASNKTRQSVAISLFLNLGHKCKKNYGIAAYSVQNRIQNIKI